MRSNFAVKRARIIFFRLMRRGERRETQRYDKRRPAFDNLTEKKEREKEGMNFEREEVPIAKIKDLTRTPREF